MSSKPSLGWGGPRAALVGLTVVCLMAHAAALGSLSIARERNVAPTATRAVSPAVQVRLLQVPLSAAAAEPLSAPGLQSIASQPPQEVVPSSSPLAPHVAGGSVPDVTLVVAQPSQHAEATAAPESVATVADSSAASNDSAYLPTSLLDSRPLPRSAPNEAYVDNVHKSGLPIRVRLFIEPTGMVSTVDVLSVAPGDEDAAAQVVAMFRDTAFSPGRRQGIDVASFMDIEVVLEPKLPEPSPLVQF